MDLKTRMQGIASVFDQKKYVYVVPADKPADISPLSIGDGKGFSMPLSLRSGYPSSPASTKTPLAVRTMWLALSNWRQLL